MSLILLALAADLIEKSCCRVRILELEEQKRSAEGRIDSAHKEMEQLKVL